MVEDAGVQSNRGDLCKPSILIFNFCEPISVFKKIKSK